MELVVSHIICVTTEDQKPRPKAAFPTFKARKERPGDEVGFFSRCVDSVSISPRNAIRTFLDYELCFKFV